MKRREFLKGTLFSALAAGCGAERAPKPVKACVNLAILGCGEEGQVAIRGCLAAGAKVVAVCDVDSLRLQEATRLCAASPYRDWRMLLAHERDLDAVVICTPDHHHFVQARAALEKNLAVYVAAPLVRTAEEFQALKALAAERDALLWNGLSDRFSTEVRQAEAALRKGTIGTLKRIVVRTDLPIWPQGMARPEKIAVAPETLDWRLWLGAATPRPYAADLYHPYNWRGWVDFGSGVFGDAATRLLALPFDAFDLPPAEKVEVLEGYASEESFPTASHLRFTWADGRELEWQDGVIDAAAAWPLDGPQFSTSVQLEGTEGIWLRTGFSKERHFLRRQGESRFLPAAEHPLVGAAPKGRMTSWRAFVESVRRGRGSSRLSEADALALTLLCATRAQRG